MRLSILVLLFSPLLYKVESETRSIHINCESEDPGFNLESADYRDPDLLVLDQCSLQDIEFWLRFLEKNYSNFITLWLKGVKVSEMGFRTENPHCAGTHKKLEKLKISETEFTEKNGETLESLLRCRSISTLEVTDNIQGFFSRIQASNITLLNASNSNIKELQDGVFSDLKNLEELDLSRNRLVKLQGGVFRNNRRLEKLHLQFNTISFISRQSFIGLRHLKYLDLSGNDIASMWLQGQVFNHLHNLKILNLSRNRITELENGILLDLPNLERLDLSRNELTRLSRAPFQNQTRLEFLSLSENSISSIEQSSLQGLSSNLRRLDVEKNKIKFIHDESLAHLVGLKTLNLLGNRLDSVPSAVKYLSDLTELNLGENEISELNSDFMLHGANLTILILEGNKVESILSNTFNSTRHLETLNLAHNRISNLQPDGFSQLTELKYLTLAENRLTDINGVLTSHPSLLRLNLSYNQLKWFDMAFFPRQLEELEIQGNQVEELGNYYKLVEGFNLKYLDASSNKISVLGQHTFVDSIEELNLRQNNISDLGSGSFAGLRNLVAVDLRYNAIRTIPRNSLKISPLAGRSPSFQLSGSPLTCDCELEWLSTYNPGGPLSPLISDFSALACSPPLAPGPPIPLGLVPEGMYVCEYRSHCFSLCRCCTFLACDCRMKCPDPCNCYHDQAWNLNMIQCGSRNLSRVLREIPMDSTILYLDDNQLENLGTEKFLGRNRLSVLYLNNSGVEQINNRTFLGLRGLKELHLENNRIDSLPWDAFQESSELEELYIHNNLIQSIGNGTFSELSNLRVLTLHGNQLTTLRIEVHIMNSLQTITLGRNPWICSCELSLMFFKVSEIVTHRVGQTTCSDINNSQQNVLTFHSSCKDLDVQAVSSKSSSSPFLILLLTSTTVIIIILAISVFLVLKRNSITRWIYSKTSSPKVEDHCQYSPMIKLPPPESLKRSVPSIAEYSAYLHYCLADDDYVKNVLSPKLESIDSRYRICLHQRDLPKSCTVGQAISHAVANSRCLLILASPAYFLSSIPTYELQMILSEVLPRYTSYPVIVAVSHSSVQEMKMKFRQIVGCQSDTWTYLEVSDILFYDRVASLVGGGVELSSDSSSCSTKSTAASTLPARVSGPRVICNPLDRFTSAPGENIYSTVVDPASDEGEPTYQTIYSDQTLYIDRNLELIKPKPLSRFRTLQ